MDCNSESGLKKAEAVFKEFIMKIDYGIDEMNRTQHYDLAKLLDVQNAQQIVKVLS